MKRRILLAGKSNFLRHLVAYFPFDGNVTDYSMSPISLSDNLSYANLKFKTGKQFLSTDVAGRIRTNDVNISKLSFTDGTTDIPFSFSFWLYYTGGANQNKFIIDKGLTGTNTIDNEYIIYIENTTNKLVLLKYSMGSSSNSKTIKTSSAISLNTLYHVVITDDGSGITKIYLNSVAMPTTTTNTGTYMRMASRNNFFAMGNRSGSISTSSAFYGIVDDLGIFRNYALTQEDVDYIYNGGIGRTLK